MPLGGALGVSLDFAWLHGLVTGDGCLFFDGNRPSNRGGYRTVINCGLDEELALAAQQCMWDVFGDEVTVKIKWHDKSHHGNRTGYFEVRCWVKAVYERLLDFEPHKGTYTWRVPQRLWTARPDTKGAWIAGLIDSDGTAVYDQGRSARSLRISSVNKEGLLEAQQLLSSIQIETAWSTCDRSATSEVNPSPEHTLLICNQESLRRAARLCPLRSPRKAGILQLALSSFGRRTTSHAEVKRLAGQAAELRRTGLSYEEIAKQLSASNAAPYDAERIRSWVRRHHPELLGEHGGGSAVSRLLSADFLEAVKLGCEAGKTARQLAAELDCKPEKIRDAVARHFPHLRLGTDSRAGRLATPQATIDKIAELRLAGVSGDQIAGAVGLSRAAVYQIAHRHKLPAGKPQLASQPSMLGS